ncbi:MAG: hypothetical protein K0R44_44 [Thermomicrobiales bacterium]|nr:hypothetical protein [Thermomicrobiales bacterium]MDF3014819.1 hypothetical protein [Thermomicrobiales bacterium]
MTYHHQWLYLRDETDAHEVFNGARTAAYLKNPALNNLGCAKISNVLDFGGCEAYAYDPPCDDDSYEVLGYSDGYVDFPGIAGNYLSTPDAALWDILGDVTFIARIAPDNWATGGLQTIVAKRSGATQHSYRFFVNFDGTLLLNTTPTGLDAATITATSTAPVAAAPGEWMWVAVSLDVADGANRTTKFWVSADAPEPSWTQLGATISIAGNTTIFNSTSPVEVGSNNAGLNNLFAGKISHVYVRAGITASHVKPAPLTDIISYGGFVPADLPLNSVSTFFASSFVVFTINRAGADQTRSAPPLGGGLSPARANHVNFPRFQTNTNVLTVADAASFSAPSQLDIRVALTISPLSPVNRILLGHFDLAGVSLSWRLQTSSFNRLVLLTSTNGSTSVNALSSVPVTTDEDLFLLRVTWRSSDGRVQYFRKDTTPDTIDADKASNTGWTQLGVNATAAVGTLFNSTSPLTIGNLSLTGASSPWNGDIYALSVATTIDGAPVVDIKTDNWPRVNDMASFPIAAGGPVAVTRATSGAALDFVFAELDDWDVGEYSDPMFDPAPWYSENIPESGDVMGFFIEEWTGLDNRHTKRTATRTGRPGGGGQLGKLDSSERVMKLNVLVLGLSERALDHAFNWLAGRLGNACATCATSSLLLRRFCPDSEEENLWSGVAELREVGLIEDLSWEDEPVKNGGCFIRRLSFTIAAGDPCMYSASSAAPGLVDTGVMATCLTSLPIGPDKVDCRPMCSDMPDTCRNVFTFEVGEATGVVAPIVTLTNDNSAPVVPLRLICYADPNEDGVVPNPCGLPILGEIYTQVIPPWTELVWDVAARKVLYSDNSTVGLEGGFRLMDAVDPPFQRFFALPCGTSHIVIEPATTCLTRDAPNLRYTYGGYIFDDSTLHFPTMSLRLQERSGCA